MAKYIEGSLKGDGRKIGIVVARFNSFIGERLLEGALTPWFVPGSTPTLSRWPGFPAPMRFP